MTRFPLDNDEALRRLAMARPSRRETPECADSELSAILGSITNQPRGRLDPVQRRRIGRACAIGVTGGATALGLVLALPGGVPPSAAEVLSLTRAALADTSHDIVEGHQSVNDGRSSTTWFDVATDASYSESVEPENGVIHDSRSWLLPDGRQINVDLYNRWWFETPVGSAMRYGIGNVPAEIQTELENGTYTVVGEPVVDGTPTLELSETIQPGETHTVWVDASTYLPIKSTDATASGTLDITTYSWEPANATNEAIFTVEIPPGFRHVTGSGAPGSAEWFGTAGSSGTAANSGNSGKGSTAGSSGTAGNTGTTRATGTSTLGGPVMRALRPDVLT